MLRPKEVIQFMDLMDDVAKDLVTLLAEVRDDNSIVQDLNDILFRWSMECRSYPNQSKCHDIYWM